MAGPHATAAPPEHQLVDAIAHVASRFLDEVDDHAERHCRSIHAAIEDFDRGAAVTAQSREAVRSTLVAFAVHVRRAELAPPVQVPSAAADYARAFVERRFPLRLLLRTYFLGQAELWQTWSASVRAARLDPAIEELVLERTHAQVLRFVERLTVGVVDVYETERELRTRSMAAIRADLVRGILEGQPTDVVEAEQALRYSLQQTHIAFIAWTPDHEDGSSRRDAAWSALVQCAGAERTFAMSAGRSVTWAWLGGSAEDLHAIADRLETWRVPLPGVQIAYSEPLRGLGGFRDAHRQALQVRRVADAAPRIQMSARRFRNFAIPALTGSDPAMTRHFVEQQLAGLGAGGDAAARLRSTLAAYFDEGENASATAARLGVHVNTVAYRLRQAEDLLGRSITERRLETQLALRLASCVSRARES